MSNIRHCENTILSVHTHTHTLLKRGQGAAAQVKKALCCHFPVDITSEAFKLLDVQPRLR